MMRTLLIITLLVVGIASTSAIAEDSNGNKDKAAIIQNNGTAAGDIATGYAVGNSAAIGVSAVSVLAGIALATLNPGGSSTSTTTTTSTIPGK